MDTFITRSSMGINIASTLKRQMTDIPWITSAIRKSIKKKNSMYRKFLKEKNGNKTTLFNKYKNYRNKLTAILRAAEKGYYANKLHQHRTNLRKVWRTINEIVGKNVYTP